MPDQRNFPYQTGIVEQRRRAMVNMSQPKQIPLMLAPRSAQSALRAGKTNCAASSSVAKPDKPTSVWGGAPECRNGRQGQRSEGAGMQKKIIISADQAVIGQRGIGDYGEMDRNGSQRHRCNS